MPRRDNVLLTAAVQQELLTDGIDQYELPKSVVTKIAKSALPDNAKLQKDTVLALVKSSTVFINYLAATAHDIATSRQHKSISASDIFNALDMIEFNHLTPLLEEQHQAWLTQSKTEKGKKSTASSSAQANGSGTSISTTPAQPSSSSATTTTARPTTSSARNGASSPTKVTTVHNGNPYPIVHPKPSNPYPTISPSGSSHDDNENKDSPFTSEPLVISKSDGGKEAKGGDGSGPMDVDDDDGGGDETE